MNTTNETMNETADETMDQTTEAPSETANDPAAYPPTERMATPDGLIAKTVFHDGRVLSTHLYPQGGGPDMNVVVQVDGKAVFAGQAVDGMLHRNMAKKIAYGIHEAMVYSMNRNRRKKALRKARKAAEGAPEDGE